MGYTHYWNTKKATNKAWDELCETVTKLIDSLEDKITGGDGYGLPEISKDCICFNGDAVEGEEHESFYILKGSESWDFCKTARKPYDAVVVATLIEAKRLKIVSSWDSDGSDDYNDFDKARELLQSVKE